jgi:hypothetical protein
MKSIRTWQDKSKYTKKCGFVRLMAPSNDSGLKKKGVGLHQNYNAIWFVS